MEGVRGRGGEGQVGNRRENSRRKKKRGSHKRRLYEEEINILTDRKKENRRNVLDERPNI